MGVRKMEPVFSGAGLVKKFAKTVDVGLRRPRSLRWNITFRADERLLSTHRHQPDVGELWHALGENDVRRFDVTMCKSARVQPLQRFSYLNTERTHYFDRHPS